MKKLLIYPFCREVSFFSRYTALLRDYEVSGLCSNRSFGYVDTDAAKCDGGPNTGRIVSDDFESLLPDCDAVLFYVDRDMPMKPGFIDKIKLSASKGKELLLTGAASGQREELETLAGCIRWLDFPQDELPVRKNERLLSLPVPVIMVAGAGNYCNKFDIQLVLRQFFLEMGYGVTQFGTKPYSELFGFKPLPAFLMKPMDMREKTIAFNHYVYDTVYREEPDVLIIGIPGGVMPVNPYYFDGIGDIAFTICNALKADIGVMSVYSAKYNNMFFDNMKLMFQYKFNSDFKYFNICNTELILTQEDYMGKYVTADYRHVMEKILPAIEAPGDILTFNIFSDEGRRMMCEHILKRLTEEP